MQGIVANNLQNSKTSIYVHYPFCESKCPYCDFNSHVSSNIDYKAFAQSYLKEIDYFHSKLGSRKISSIFFGGGTPSLMPMAIFEAILTAIFDKFKVEKDAEITVEANPGSFEVAKFRNFKDAGANRISIGVQSFNDHNLKFLGRKHYANEAKKAIKDAAKIFDNYSFDLMHSIQGQRINDWLEELELACSFNSKHLSVYQLTIEKGTRFFSDVKSGKIAEMDEDDQLEFFEKTRSFLAKKGYENYEISNFAKKGFESKHNLNYWQGGEYIGIGAGAHSRLSFDNCKKTRSALINFHQPEKWQRQIIQNQHAIQSSKLITEEEFLEELILSGLRLKNGIKTNQLEKIFSLQFEEIFDLDSLHKLKKQGLIEIESSSLKIQQKYTSHTNTIVAKIIDCANLP